MAAFLQMKQMLQIEVTGRTEQVQIMFPLKDKNIN